MNIINEAKMKLEYLDKLKKMCNSLINSAEELDLRGFKGIKIIQDSLLHPTSDGNTRDKTILLPKDKTEKYLKEENYDLIKSTIYHELCHIDLSNKLPYLHDLHKQSMEEEDYIKSFTIMIYIEYIAHLKSSKIETCKTKNIFYDSVNKKHWNFLDECDKIMFIKTTPYIIGRDEKSEYLNKLENSELRKRILEVAKELKKLPKSNFVDSYYILHDLEILVSKYITNY